MHIHYISINMCIINVNIFILCLMAHDTFKIKDLKKANHRKCPFDICHLNI